LADHPRFTDMCHSQKIGATHFDTNYWELTTLVRPGQGPRHHRKPV